MEPRDAATVLLCRDAPQLEVFLLQRHRDSAFAASAHVFPGGAVDPHDAALEPIAADDATDQVPTPFRVAALREAFEEAGVLLARDRRTGQLVDAASLAPARAELRRGATTWADLLGRLDVRLDLAALTPIARFVTPPGAPRRFDTWFFVAAAPPGHEYRHDDVETVASTWMRPDDALRADRRGAIWLVDPTRHTLEAIRPYATAAGLLAAARAAWAEPRAVITDDDARAGWLLPLAAGRVFDDAARRPEPV